MPMASLPLRPPLKDQLFNAETLCLLSEPLAKCFSGFEAKGFTEQVLAGFAERELSERMRWIRAHLRKFLPEDYRRAVALILQALPEPCDPELSDGDFGHFIYTAYGDFVAHYGCTPQNLDFSLQALKAITTRFSAEYAIRPFLLAFPEQTLQQLSLWAQDAHYHVRRWVSEGTRPKLPWGKAVHLSWEQCMPLLRALHADPTRFVQRSVANHLNDWSKIYPEQVLNELQHWQVLQQANAKDLDFMVRHSLRTLVKEGHGGALRRAGYDPHALFAIEQLRFSERVHLGGDLSLSFTLVSKALAPQRIAVDYVVFYRNKKGALTPKVYKLKQLTLFPSVPVNLQKQLRLQPRSTRTLYTGTHAFALQINGQQTQSYAFELHNHLN